MSRDWNSESGSLGRFLTNVDMFRPQFIIGVGGNVCVCNDNICNLKKFDLDKLMWTQTH